MPAGKHDFICGMLVAKYPMKNRQAAYIAAYMTQLVFVAYIKNLFLYFMNRDHSTK